MDNKTAMQELISWLKEVDAPSGIIKQAESQLPKERQQMIGFAKYCSQNTDYATSYDDCYNQTYTQNNNH